MAVDEHYASRFIYFYKGNILQDILDSTYITELGFTTDVKSDNKITGVLPYVDPEVLQGQESRKRQIST
ncbi:4997_t:CDS:2, partial [Cetraspora pellucida]